MFEKDKLFSYCIYTMKKSDDLEYCYRNGRTGTFSENKSWKTGIRLLAQANKDNILMPILFSAAEEASGIIYVGFLSSIEIHEGSKEGTTYSFRGMVRLSNPKPLSSLILRDSRKPLSNNYIRPYAVCVTPDALLDWIYECGRPPLNKARKDGSESFNNGVCQDSCR